MADILLAIVGSFGPVPTLTDIRLGAIALPYLPTTFNFFPGHGANFPGFSTFFRDA